MEILVFKIWFAQISCNIWLDEQPTNAFMVEKLHFVTHLLTIHVSFTGNL
jgi:hypothetical protein